MYDDFECSVLEEGEQTRWFKITTGVKQGCVMPRRPFPAYCLLDNAKNNRNTSGIRDGSSQVSLKTSKTRLCRRYSPTDLSKYKHIQNKTNRQEDKAVRVGLKLNAQKCEVTRMKTK